MWYKVTDIYGSYNQGVSPLTEPIARINKNNNDNRYKHMQGR